MLNRDTKDDVVDVQMNKEMQHRPLSFKEGEGGRGLPNRDMKYKCATQGTMIVILAMTI